MADDTALPAPVLILGSGRHVGLGLARRLIERGRPLILTYRRAPREVVELEMANPGLVLASFPFDASSPQAVARLFERVGGKTERLSAVINCVGPFVQKRVVEMSADEVQQVIDGNLTQAFHVARHAFPFLKRNGSGRLIHFTQAGVERLGGYELAAAAAAAKAGLLSLTRSLARQWAAERITVNAVAPGIVETADEAQRLLLRRQPGARLTTLDDLAGAVFYLLSPEADAVSGVNLSVAAGWGL